MLLHPGADGEQIIVRIQARYLLLATCLASASPADACQQLPIIHFGFGSATPDEQAIAQLRGFAQQAVGRMPDIENIRIVGHSDRMGSAAARRRIAVRRALAVRDMLAAYGIPAALFLISGQADRAPWIETADNVREPQNRRAELMVTLTAAAIVRQNEPASSGGPGPVC